MTIAIKGGDNNDIQLSNNIETITAEINTYQRIAGEAIFEIGRRLKHVKDNDLVHGEFGKWLETVNIHERQSQRMIRIFERFSKATPVSDLPKSFSVLYELTSLTDEELTKEYELPSGETKKPTDMSRREIEELKRQLKAEQKERERLESENEELSNREPEIRTEFIEVEDREYRDRSFDTPYGVKLLDDFYNAMDELSEWQKKYAWITSDNEQLKTFVKVDEDMREEFRKNSNMWRTLEKLFNDKDSNIIDAEIIDIN